MKTLLLLLVALRLDAAPTVEQKDVTLTDGARKREIPLRVYYPSGRGQLPLVVFSHGLGGSREGYRYLGDAWAAAGYVVAVPTHAGSDAAIFERRHPFKNLRKLKDAQKDPEGLKHRAADLTYLLDHLDDLPIKDRIDRQALGLAGHGLGTAAPRDARFKAFIAMAPQIEGNWAQIRGPFMAMAGVTKDKLPKWRLSGFNDLPAGDKYAAFLEGAGQFAASGDGKFHRYVARLTTAFWDAYLKKDGAAKALLAQDLVGKESKGEVRVEAR